MVKRILYLVTGIALLAVSAYFFLGVVQGWKPFWRQEITAKIRPRNYHAISDDSIAGAAKSKVYGVLSPDGLGGDGDDGAPARSDAPQVVAPAPFEHVPMLDPDTPAHFLHKRFPVKLFQAFEFVVPPHSLHPRLQGRFRAVAADGNVGGSAMELILMNDEEFGDFVNNKAGTTTFSEAASSGRQVIWGLSQTSGAPQKYYLVFRNVSKRFAPTTVDADFTASFE